MSEKKKSPSVRELPFARLVFSRGVSEASIVGARLSHELYRAHHDGPVRIEERDGVVTIGAEKKRWFGSGVSEIRLELADAVPWEIAIHGGVSELDADLRKVLVRSVEIVGGASETRFRLGRPRGAATFRLSGGASELSLTRPSGVGLSLHLRGGAGGLSLDGFRFGAVGGPVRWESQDYRDALDRYDVELTGGASDVVMGRQA